MEDCKQYTIKISTKGVLMIGVSKGYGGTKLVLENYIIGELYHLGAIQTLFTVDAICEIMTDG